MGSVVCPFDAQHITGFGDCDSWKISTQFRIFYTCEIYRQELAASNVGEIFQSFSICDAE